MTNRPPIIFLLIDGLGIGPEDPRINPIHSGVCPHIAMLIAEHAVPIDARLGVAGIPQSATGQTALLTGVNAAQAMGRHVEGFPGPRLREIIRKHNIYDQLKGRGCRSTFANAYFLDDVTEAQRRKRQSVTTVATLKAFGGVRDKAFLDRNEAVYQDLTRSSLKPRGYAGRVITPEEAAQHLAGIAAGHDLTLFEYFQTDRAGHKGTAGEVAEVLKLLDRFIGELLRQNGHDKFMLVLTSDHGNIEDSRTRGHTDNPAPFVVCGAGAAALMKKVASLTDVTPALVEYASAAS